MAEAFKKIDKDFVLSDSSLNVYGFKLKTSGYQVEEYKKLPIGYFNHKDKDDGALVRWDDIRVEGDKILGKPVINLSHPRGQRTVDEVNSNFINAASMAKLVILETSTEPSPKKGGKPIPVVTKWYNKECDLVTLPGNRNALAVPQLFDANNNEIQLSDLFNNDIINLPMTQIPKEILQALSLSDDATSVAALAAITELADKAGKYDLLKKNTVKDKVKVLLDEAQKPGECKLSNELRAELADKYGEDPEGLERVLKIMTPIPNITGSLKPKGDENSMLYKELSDMSFDDMGEKELLDKCSEQFPDLFKNKYIGQFGKEAWEKSPYADK